MKQKRKAVWMLACILSAASLLQGCGGSGGGSRMASGVFVGAPVSGLEYRTDSASGTTDADGRFSYLPGENVTFSLGTLTLGQTTAKAEVTLVDMSEIGTLPSNATAIGAALSTAALPGPLHRVVNMAVLLESLDDDANPDNGVRIDPLVLARIEAAVIDLDSAYEDFADDGNFRNGRGLRSLLRTATAAGELVARPAVHPALALGRVYESLGSLPEIWLSQLDRSDSNADGVIDYLTEFRFDDSGIYLGSRTDEEADGRFDYSDDREIGDNLEILSIAVDQDEDGRVDRLTRYRYDAFGVLLEKETTDMAGATTALETLEYDDAGRLVRRETLSGTNRQVQHWIVDEAGLRSVYEIDSDGDGAIDARSILGYDGNQRSDLWVRRENDTDLDGMPDSSENRQLDARGRILSVTRDDDLDGSPDYQLERRFDEQGRQVSLEIDRDGGGFDYRRTWTISADGTTVLRQTDDDADGIVDVVERLADLPTGQPLSYEVDADGDGAFESATRYAYDDDGRLISSERSAGGVVDQRTERVYDAAGRLSRVEIDADADGILNSVTSYGDYMVVGLAALL